MRYIFEHADNQGCKKVHGFFNNIFNIKNVTCISESISMCFTIVLF